MTKKTKWIMFEETDVLNCQDFLNKVSSNGWQFVGFGTGNMKFEYRPGETLMYAVINHHPVTFRDAQDEKNDYLFNELMDDFNYTLVDSNGLFSVYSSKEQIPYFTDPQLEKETLKRVGKRSLYYLLLVIFIAYISFESLIRNHRYLYLTYFELMAWMSIVTISIYSIANIFNSYRFIKGRQRYESIRFKSLKTDWLTVLTALPFIVLILSILLNGVFRHMDINFVYLIGLFLFVFLSMKVFENKKNGNRIAGIVATLVGLGILIFLITSPQEKTYLNLDSLKTMNKEFFVHREDIGDFAQKIELWSEKDDLTLYEIFEVKGNLLDEPMMNRYLSLNQLESVPKHEISQHDKLYYYIDDRFVIKSSTDQIEDIVSELLKRNQ